MFEAFITLFAFITQLCVASIFIAAIIIAFYVYFFTIFLWKHETSSLRLAAFVMVQGLLALFFSLSMVVSLFIMPPASFYILPFCGWQVLACLLLGKLINIERVKENLI